MSTTNNKNLGHATAYGYAKSKGYTGTEEEFAELMASYADVGQTAVDAALAAQTAKGKAEEAQGKAEEAQGKAEEAQGKAEEAQTYAQTAQAAAEQAAREALAGAGTPLVAQTAAAMTDQTKIYVYLGSETGYTNGDWYYWDGSAWTSGGVYNAEAINTDTTLTVPGAAADAETTGKTIGDIDNAFRIVHVVWEQGNINTSGANTSADYAIRTDYIPCEPGEQFVKYSFPSGTYATDYCYFYNSGKTFIERNHSNIAPENAAYMRTVLNRGSGNIVVPAEGKKIAILRIHNPLSIEVGGRARYTQNSATHVMDIEFPVASGDKIACIVTEWGGTMPPTFSVRGLNGSTTSGALCTASGLFEVMTCVLAADYPQLRIRADVSTTPSSATRFTALVFKLGTDKISNLAYTIRTVADNVADKKVDKISGKGLSTNDFTDAEKTALDNIKDTDGELSPNALLKVYPLSKSNKAADSRVVAYGLMGAMGDRETMDLSPYKTKWFVMGSGKWTKYGDSSSVYSYIVDLSGISRLDVTAHATNQARMYFLKTADPVQGEAVDTSSIYTSQQAWTDAVRTYFVPIDAKYVWIKGLDEYGVDCTPTITFNRVKANTDTGFSKTNAAAESKATGDAISNGIALAADTGDANVNAFLAIAKTYFDNRTTLLNGSQSMLYHDGNTILDDTTTHTANIECSTFVTLCMRALAYADTSYSHVLSTAAAPADWKDNPDYYWSINPFDWNVSHLASGENPHPVRYAAAVARWMVEHGYEVVLYGDKSNIRPGDILFFSRHSEPGGDYLRPTFYKAINHIGICYSAQATPRYDVVESMSAMSDTSKRYVYDGDWYYYKDSAWHDGGVYVDPDEFPITHEMIHAATDETNTTRFVPPYPTFVSSSADIGSSSQGGGHGSIYIEVLESRRGDTVNGIDTLCMVCRPIPGSLWAEKIDARLRALETALAALQ